jgi:AcrR family transcriptional regulator
MATSRATGGRRRRNSGALPRSDADRIIDAAFARVATEGWRSLSLAAIADAAELPIGQVYRLFGSKQAILCGFSRRIDETVLAEPPRAEAQERPRDRLFDLLMRRFDALQAHKPALEVVRRELATDPVVALCAIGTLLRSMRWMLEAADFATGGMRGALAVKLTAAAYLSAMRVWQRDDSPDLARTMAALDARLRRIEPWLVPAYHPRREGETLTA